jgi:hypothetical protein
VIFVIFLPIIFLPSRRVARGSWIALDAQEPRNASAVGDAKVAPP